MALKNFKKIALSLYRLKHQCGCLSLNNNRVISYSTDPKHTDNDPHEHLHPPGGVKTYIVKKYVDYIAKFEFKVEKHYPRFYKVYRIFKDGIAEFFNDTKLYSVIATRIWAGEELSAFTWRELETYRQMPSDLLRSAPILIAAPLPAVPYVFYPLCYKFPRHLLCRHFWTPEQKMEFGLHYLHQRLLCYPKILHSLERHSSNIRDPAKRHMFQDILFKIEHNDHPSVEELLEIKDLFTGRPFGLEKAPKLQMWYVARSLNFSTLSGWRFKNDALLLHNIDLALCREGMQLHNLESLQQSCITRGLSPRGLPREEILDYLTLWTTLSQNIDESNLSLLAHAPVLLSYNKPTNKPFLHNMELLDDDR